MAFETGTATSVTDLLGKLYTFATGTAGWTGHQTAGVGPVLSDQHSISSPDGLYMNFVSQVEYIECQPATGYTAGGTTTFLQQPGSPTTGKTDTDIRLRVQMRWGEPGTWLLGETGNYWIFASTSSPYYIHLVVEEPGGRFGHLMFGLGDAHYSDADPIASAYVTSSSFQSAEYPALPFMHARPFNVNVCGAWVRYPNGLTFTPDTGGPAASNVNGNWAQRIGWTPRDAIPESFWTRVSAWDWVDPGKLSLSPVTLKVRRNSSGNTPWDWCSLGTAPDIAFVGLYLDQSTSFPLIFDDLGGDEWYIFPVISHGTVGYGPYNSGVIDSGALAMAYKRI